MLPAILFCGTLAFATATESINRVDGDGELGDDDSRIPPISAPAQAPLIIWEPIMKPNIMPFVVPIEKPTAKPRPCCCQTINLDPDIDYENPKCCPAEPLTPAQCNDIVWKSGYCAYDPSVAKDCWTPKPSPEPTREEPTPEPTREECCCKTVNVKPDDPFVNKECCPELFGGLPWSPQECNRLQWNTGKCVFDLDECPTEKPTPEPVKECCCKTANVDPNNPWVNPECCPELYGNGLPWTPQECGQLQWSTGRCWYDVKECPTEKPTPEPTEKPTKPAPTERPTEEPTPETTAAPTEFCSARCYGLNSKDDALNQQMFLGQCTDRTGPWSGWYNRDNPDMTGDWELLEIEPNQPCNGETPVGAECETVGGVQWDQTGMVFHTPCGPTGIVCRHADNVGNCPDFRVRYQCPGPCECELPPTVLKGTDTTECDCCSDFETKGECKKHKCSTTKKKGGKHVMKKKKCKWKKNACTCKFKNPLESHCQ